MNPSTVGQAVTLTATVTFRRREHRPEPSRSTTAARRSVRRLSTPEAKPRLTFTTLTAGTHSLVASYSGDTGHNPSSSSALSQVVNAASGAATSTALASSPNPSTLGQSVTFTATVTSATAGTPDWKRELPLRPHSSRDGALERKREGRLRDSPVLAAGLSPRLRATYNGDATFSPSTSAVLTQAVMEATSTALTSSANPSGPGQSVTFTATITPAAPSSAYPTGTVTFSDGSTVLGTGVVFYPGRALYSTSALSTRKPLDHRGVFGRLDLPVEHIAGSRIRSSPNR